MTLAELAKMRRMRAKPTWPIVLTDDSDVHFFCTQLDVPVIWTPAFKEDEDLSPLYGLEVWVVSYLTALLADRVKERKPKSMWTVGPSGYRYRMQEAAHANGFHLEASWN